MNIMKGLFSSSIYLYKYEKASIELFKHFIKCVSFKNLGLLN